ncbi:leucine-rich repeat domain-containing protein [Vibrio hyugaensis]|uniref:leucine-rich repeat domain-containing protein n=1 Tax=Vibrio hyugaensis TaxID=1534743 RepID=UPI0005EE6D27|nr:leucine-rich repeat domain-containing protein [Vibrio hyugaensis]
MLEYTIGKVIAGLSILAVLVGCSPPEKVSEIRFSDENFEKCVLDLGVDELDQVVRLICSDMRIEDAEEIKYFSQLTHLDLSLNDLSGLDVSSNPKLQQIEVWGQLTENGFKSFTLATLPELTILSVAGDQLEKTDITAATFEKQLPNLDELSFVGTPPKGNFTLSLQHRKLRNLSIIDLTKHEDLTAKLKLDLDFPALTDVYIETPALEFLSLNNSHQLESISVVNTPLTSLSLADMPNLTEARLGNNKLSDLTLNNLPALRYLDVDNNQIESLDTRTLPALNKLYLSQNQLKNILYAQPNLISVLALDNNQLTSFDFQLIPNITSYSLDNNPLAKVEEQFDKNTNLYYCITVDEQLPYISEIKEIYCTSNGNVIENGDFTRYNSLELLVLTAFVNNGTINLSTLDDLKRLGLKITNLDKIKWPKNSALEEMYLGYTDATSLSIPTLPKLKELEIERLEQLETLTIAPQPSLISLEINRVNAPKLTMQQAPELTKLTVIRSPIRELVLEDMPALEQIQIYQAPVESLTLRNMPNLKEICLYYVPTTTRISGSFTNKELQSLVTRDCH